VVRTTRDSDGEWTLGCSFVSDLSEEALRELLV
jgi:hypothetical protein